MIKILVTEDAYEDLNQGFLFYEAQEYGMGDYFTVCLRADIEGLRITAGLHKQVAGFHKLLSRVFPYGVFYTYDVQIVTIWAVLDLRRDPLWIKARLQD